MNGTEIKSIVPALPGFFKAVPVYDKSNVAELMYLPIIAWSVSAFFRVDEEVFTVVDPITTDSGGGSENYFVANPDGTHDASDITRADNAEDALEYAKRNWGLK